MSSSFEPSLQLLPDGATFKSRGGSFGYRAIGPVCRLFDRDELPWPCCSLQWRGKQPSWNRIGKRFVADLAASRAPSYSVEGVDAYGSRWHQVITLYEETLSKDLRDWWNAKKPLAQNFPQLPAGSIWIKSASL